MKLILFVFTMCFSVQLIAQPQVKPQYHFCFVSSVDYGFTGGTILFSPPINLALHDTSTQVPSFEQNGFNHIGYSLGLCTDIPLDSSGTSWLKIETGYQQLTLNKVKIDEYLDVPIDLNGQQSRYTFITESKTSLSYSNYQCNILYGMNINSSPLRWSIGLRVSVLTNQKPVEQTFRLESPSIFYIVLPDSNNNWLNDYNYRILTNTETAKQSSSIQLGGVVEIDYSINVSKFYLMPFVQYNMMFTTITKETPLYLHTIRAGIGASLYL